MTVSATPAAEDHATAAARPARRGPADLPFRFPDRGLALALSAERSEPQWLRAERLAAFSAYEALPVEGNRLYTPYVDLRAADLMEVQPYVRTETVGPADATVPDDTAGLIELREDGVTALALSADAAKAGVILETFAAALERDPAGLRADLEGGPSLPADDKLAQLARGFWSQGVRLIVPDGVRLERPFLVRWAVGAPGRALVSRTLVRLGESAQASLVEEFVASGPEIACAEGETVPQAFFGGTLEVVLGRAANLSVAAIQDLPPDVVSFQHRHATIGPAASLHWALAQLGGRLIRSRVDNRLEGDGSSVEQVEIVFGADQQLFDLTSYTRHIGRDTTGNLLSKGALQDAARSYMKGLIVIDKTAIGTDSFLGEFGMNLSKQARAVAIPSLEIDQPDCRRAAHSSSVGPIDDTQLFYLESRGIDPDEARKFIVLGFLEPVVAKVPLAEAQDRLRGLLEEKWAAGATASAGAVAAAAVPASGE
ncbi:MAG: Fe-S cluster assembly protein SufD [Chloroflexota bacterium]|jgi:Fe-S cluster assembly scaffold protein SufB|nr:Fe-S cluster assembly protein SufD [Chloroflexota bacterium]